jgi:hypothetical protein
MISEQSYLSRGCHDEGTEREEETKRLCFGRWIGQEISFRQEECEWYFPIIRIRPLENDSIPA